MSILAEHVPELVALGALLVVSGFFSGAEAALFSLPREKLGELARGGKVARSIASLMEDSRALLSTILFGNMLVNVTFYSIAALIVAHFGESYGRAAVVAGGAAVLFTVIVFGEVTPKMLAVRHPIFVADLAALPLFLFHGALAPARALVGGLAGRGKKPSRSIYITPEELRLLIDLTAERGVLGADERRMMQDIVNLGRLRVRDVMTPRVDVVSVEESVAARDLLRLASESGKTKFPVWRRERDNIIGVVSAKEVFLSGAAEGGVGGFVHPVKFVPEAQKASDLLRIFKEEDLRIALAVDEYGEIAGLITADDVFEEVVGRMEDEYARGRELVAEAAPGEYLLDGALGIYDWGEIFGLPPESSYISTIGGFVTALLGRLPKAGDVVRYRNVAMIVEAVHRGRVAQVRVSLTGGAGGERP